ncbi:protein RRNAD1-like isoform X1 [Sergentomyia squamirostris]
MNNLEEVIRFLTEYQWIYKHSNTKYLKSGVLDQFPPGWIGSLRSLNQEELNNIPFGRIPQSLDEDLKEFLRTILRLKVDIPIVQIKEDDKDRRSIKGISPKKMKEISSLSFQIHQICQKENIHNLVDLGSGLGYLCQMLFERHKYKILGVECDEERVKSARLRQEKYFPSSRDCVKFVSHFVTEDSWEFLSQELKKAFEIHPDNTSLALVGLHACGDLTVTSVRIFQSTENIRVLAVMPCCYHKMEINSIGKPLNFPLSQRFRTVLTSNPAGDEIPRRPFLRLACQQPASRWKRMSEEEHKIHGNNMFRRAMLDTLVDTDEEVHRIKKARESVIHSDDEFEVAICGFEIRNRNTGTSMPWKSEHRSKWRILSRKYFNGGELSEHLTLLQTTIQEICENMILFDRKVYVEEASAHFRCELLKILDADISPRCVLLLATKTTKS